MRLIDKEKLLEQLTSLEKRNKVSSMVVDIVAMTREESAIPIEWLKNKSKDLADAYWNNVRNKLVLEMKDLPLVMDLIVEEWEKRK